jgi:hypothetical protein
MAPKGKKTAAKAKAKGATAASKAKALALVTATSAGTVVGVSPRPGPKRKGSKIAEDCTPEMSRRARRGVVDQVQRLIDGKLAGLDDAMLESRRNSKGQSVRDALEEALVTRGMGESKKYLSSRFWVSFYESFSLASPGFPGLPKLDEQAEHNPELVEVLLMVHNENPIQRTEEPFLRYLDHSPAATEQELIGMLHSSVEGALVSRRLSHRMQLAILSHIGKSSLHENFPDIWKEVHDRLDLVLMHEFKTMEARGVLRHEFVARYSKGCGCFMNLTLLSGVEDALSKSLKPDPVSLTGLMQSQIGGAMFTHEGLRFQYETYVANCNSRLSNLSHNDFETTEVETFRTLMANEANHLVKAGVARFERTMGSCAHKLVIVCCWCFECVLVPFWDVMMFCWFRSCYKSFVCLQLFAVVLGKVWPRHLQ